MPAQFRPSLACDASWEDFERILSQGDQLYASPKLDGIRAVVLGGRLVSRTLKPIRNRYIQAILGREELEGLDGELVVGAPYGEGVFARTSSGVMSEFGEPDFKYYIFDDHTMGAEGLPFYVRHTALKEAWPPREDSAIHLLEQYLIVDLEALEFYEKVFVDRGYEGVITRWSHSPYKQNRSTLRERYMLKLKRFADSEATIIGFEELRHNMNEATEDNRGYTARSSHQDNKVGGETMGALIVQDLHNPSWEFKIGTGFDAALRQYIWDHQDEYLNKIAAYKYLPVGTIDRPRHPVFKGLRSSSDIG